MATKSNEQITPVIGRREQEGIKYSLKAFAHLKMSAYLGHMELIAFVPGSALKIGEIVSAIEWIEAEIRKLLAKLEARRSDNGAGEGAEDAE